MGSYEDKKVILQELEELKAIEQEREPVARHDTRKVLSKDAKKHWIFGVKFLIV